MSVDPLAEMQPNKTPYHYCSNNPINRTDPTGMIDGDYYSNKGNWLGHDGNDDNKVYVLNSESSPNYKNETVNWGGKLSETHASNLKQNSQEAKMPGKITHSLDSGQNASADKYNMYDKEIAVATHLFNREISNGTAAVGEGYNIGTQASLLDVNLVKALAYKESRLGQGTSQSTNASDIFSMFNMRDYGDKHKMGMTESDVVNGQGPIQSTHWGVRWLYFKSMLSPDGKTKNFGGWEKAIQRYGPGLKEPGYKDAVMKIYNSIQ